MNPTESMESSFVFDSLQANSRLRGQGQGKRVGEGGGGGGGALSLRACLQAMFDCS